MFVFIDCFNSDMLPKSRKSQKIVQFYKTADAENLLRTHSILLHLIMVKLCSVIVPTFETKLLERSLIAVNCHRN